MIRRAREDDTDAIIDIWLQGSRLAHAFIPYAFWTERAADMRNLYLPSAETFVKQDSDGIIGFVSLVDDHLAALFVRPSAHGRGYGKELLTFAQDLRKALTLCVYAQNEHAVGFYLSAGFRVLEEREEPNAGRRELVMEWTSAAPAR